ncbi:hypothetical protein G6F64_015273 [Rhizopus arrhizus]|uniref:Uncharacterized protein n=1 Tax=Rhizopus oryzae TaxID=64495 RepID=A0A9P7BJ00_RHIOR|nr:hypothetical protein G6F64_015273 [Rhizopus arrhizus]
MDHPRRRTAGAGRKVALVDDQAVHALQRQIAEHAHAIDAGAHDHRREMPARQRGRTRIGQGWRRHGARPANCAKAGAILPISASNSEWNSACACAVVASGASATQRTGKASSALAPWDNAS